MTLLQTYLAKRKLINGATRELRLPTINSSNITLLDKMKKNIIALFENEGLSITIEINLFEKDF